MSGRRSVDVGFDGEIWHVRRGTDSVGEILIEEADFPWLSGRFTAGPAFAEVAGLFARELTLAESDDAWDEWEAAYDEIRRHLSLFSPDGPVPEFLLHISGNHAWFRWSDEPFGDDES